MNRMMQHAENSKSSGRQRNLSCDASGDQPAKDLQRRCVKLTEKRPLFILDHDGNEVYFWTDKSTNGEK